MTTDRRNLLHHSHLASFGAALLMCAAAFNPAFASDDAEKHWYSWFWPLGETKDVEELSDEYIPFRTERGSEPQEEGETTNTVERRWSSTLFSLGGDQNELKQDFEPLDSEKANLYDLPPRPKLFTELGDGFLDTGQLDAGFEVPILGAVWQPRLWSYFIYRMAFQSYDNAAPGVERESEWAHRLDLFVNLQLTGTEKAVLGLRPLDNNRPNQFTRYTFQGRNEGFNDEFNYIPETFFFEGDLGSLFPVFDRRGVIPLDFGFTVGRQPITFQEGILINDTVDALGFIRNNIPVRGLSNFRVSGMWAWNRLDRNDLGRNSDEDMFALFAAADGQYSTFNLDAIYVRDDGNGDGFYIGASAIQRVAALDGMSTAFRVNASFALEDEIPGQPGNVVGDGVLLTAEFSKHPHGSDDIVYFNPFLAIGNFTQAGREPVVGGPLANTGILFASPGLGNYLAELNPFTDDDVGAAVGYQAFWDNNRRNLILEIAGKHSYGGQGFDQLGFGFQLQQAVGQYMQLQFEAYYALNEDRDDSYGARAEMQIVY